MPGYQKINKNKVVQRWKCLDILIHTLLLDKIECLLSIIIFLLIITINPGCKTTEEAEKEKIVETGVNEFLAKYEKTFDPGAYDEDVDTIIQLVKRQREIIEPSKIVAILPPETIQGFRVQVLFTPDIQQANRLRDELTERLTDTWTYIVHDAPYYKIRVGNHIDRPSAATMMKKLHGMGYKDAWIVPDKIIKNPLPLPPDALIEATKQPALHE